MRALPTVEPHLERGHRFRSEYRWQETECRTRGYHAPTATCGCSNYHRLSHAAYRAHERAGLGASDDPVTGRQALRLIRPYLPAIRTEAELFKATAWTPVKVLLQPTPRWCLYTNTFLLMWAKARATGKPAPWEAAQRRAA